MSTFNMFATDAEFPAGIRNLPTFIRFTGADGVEKAGRLLPGVLMAIENMENGIDKTGIISVEENSDTVVSETHLPKDAEGFTKIIKLILNKDSADDVRGDVYISETKSTMPFTPSVKDLTTMASLYSLYVGMLCAMPAYTVLSDYVQNHRLSDFIEQEALEAWAEISREIQDRCTEGKFPFCQRETFKRLLKTEKYNAATASSQAVSTPPAGNFKLKGYKCPDEVKGNLVNMPQWYETPEWVYDICIEAQNPQVRNFYLKGKAGTGKTSGAMKISEELGLPYFCMTGNESMEMIDILGGLLPNTDEIEKQEKEDATVEQTTIESLLGQFTDDDWTFNLPKISKALGLNEDATYMDIMKYVQKKVAESIVKSTPSKEERLKSQYTYVPSALVKALKYGGVCEFQEVKSIRKPGVLVGLNHILEIGDSIEVPLPNGETVKKSPYCFFVFTTNENYEGCRPLNQSVLSRMQYDREIELPPMDERIARVKKKTNFADDSLLKRMAQTIEEIDQFLEENDIKDGVCGMRELEAWATSCVNTVRFRPQVLLDENLVKKCGEYTVLQKCSQEGDDIEAVRTAIWDKNWA